MSSQQRSQEQERHTYLIVQCQRLPNADIIGEALSPAFATGCVLETGFQKLDRRCCQNSNCPRTAAGKEWAQAAHALLCEEKGQIVIGWQIHTDLQAMPLVSDMLATTEGSSLPKHACLAMTTSFEYRQHGHSSISSE